MISAKIRPSHNKDRTETQLVNFYQMCCLEYTSLVKVVKILCMNQVMPRPPLFVTLTECNLQRGGAGRGGEKKGKLFTLPYKDWTNRLFVK